jgi:hypothetical protein
MNIHFRGDLMLDNRDFILRHLQELQADFEDFSNQDLIDCRNIMLERVNECLEALFESEEDNEVY